MLGSYGATTDRDLFLAAEIIGFSFATLDALSRLVADPDLSVTTRLRLRSNANALSRGAEGNRKILARTPRADPHPEGPPIPVLVPSPASPPTLPSAIQKVRDAIVEAVPTLAETLTNAGQAMSRQQRSFLTRKAEQVRASQEREARKAARLAPRATASA